LHFEESDHDLRDFLETNPEPFGKPTFRDQAVALEPGTGDHTDVYANFLEAIRHGTPLVAEGVEGRMSLELANALIYSSHAGRQVDLPLDRAAYTALLARLRNPGS